MDRLRVLVLGQDCNPDRVSAPFVAYCHAAALAKLHNVTLAVHASVEDVLRRAKDPFQAVEVIRTPLLDRIFNWGFRKIFKGRYDSQALTAFTYFYSVGFELQAWRQLRRRILAGEFDVVLRLMPITAVLPSPFAFFLRKGPIPFVVGPINGGLPFVRGFSQAEKQKEWISSLRRLYRFMPFASSTYRNAAAIVAASSQTYAEFCEHRDRLFFIPENGISRSVCHDNSRRPEDSDKLELVFAGYLIPCKGCDLALRAVAPLLRDNSASFSILGDGPERNRLEQLASSLKIDENLSFCGWVSHEEVLKRLQSADVLVFPSIRDFGAGVVFEALATGAVPVVADFGGPGDIVHPEVGYKVPITNEDDVVLKLEDALRELAHNRAVLRRLREAGMSYARDQLTWDAKAQTMTRVLNWVVGRGQKPNLVPPKILSMESAK